MRTLFFDFSTAGKAPAMPNTITRNVITLMLVSLGWFGTASSQKIEKIKDAHVSDPMRVVVVSGGFRKGRELDFIYPSAATVLIKKLFQKAPFDSLSYLFEAYLISVASQDSGISRPGRQVQTFFGEYWDKSPTLSEIGIERLDSLRYELLPEYNLERDATLMVLQDNRFSGGSYLQERISLAPMWHPLAPVVVWHELGGHVEGYNPETGSLPGDEYPADIYKEFGDQFPEDSFVNITHKTKYQLEHLQPKDIKWCEFLTPGIELPTKWIEPNRYKTGLFGIDSTWTSGLGIPSDHCIMRANHGEFCKPDQKAIREAVLARYRMKPLIADLDQDGQVDLSDFKLFESAFGTRKGDKNFLRRADLNHDKVIDLDDFFLFVGAFGQTRDRRNQKPAPPRFIASRTRWYIPFIPPG